MTYSSISHHRYDPIFATASSTIEIWDETKTSPLSTLKFHSTSSIASGEQIVCVAFNKSETSILASSGSDRTVCLYDLRSGKAVGRVAMNVCPHFHSLRAELTCCVTQMCVNSLVFNPLQPPVLLCASEDHNLYTFDIRNLSTSTQVYKGHVGACVIVSSLVRTALTDLRVAESCPLIGRRPVENSFRDLTIVPSDCGLLEKGKREIRTTRSECNGQSFVSDPFDELELM